MQLGTLKDYVGRSVDLYALADAPGRSDGLSSQVIVSPSNQGQLIAGIRKLFQRFVVELLTEQGSLTYKADRGTLFIPKIRIGSIRTTQELYAAFVDAEMDIRVNLQLEELQTDPPDERYKSASLEAASLFGDTVTMTIKITSQAGTELTVIYPLNVNIT